MRILSLFLILALSSVCYGQSQAQINTKNLAFDKSLDAQDLKFEVEIESFTYDSLYNVVQQIKQEVDTGMRVVVNQVDYNAGLLEELIAEQRLQPIVQNIQNANTTFMFGSINYLNGDGNWSVGKYNEATLDFNTATISYNSSIGDNNIALTAIQEAITSITEAIELLESATDWNMP